MSAPITIVVVRALGLSGATWFNLVLGSHDDVMSMGPPARILDLPASEADQACFIHREHCDFWPAFFRQGDHRGHFFKSLAAFSGKRVFIVNYPPSELMAREIDGQGFRVLSVRLQRDGRATLYSRMRHYGTLTPGTAIFHMTNWQIPIWDRVDRHTPSDPSMALTVRYEDMIQDPAPQFARLGEFIGIRYSGNSTRFWEYTQHMTAGNTGVIDLIRRLQGEDGLLHKRTNAYSELAGKLQNDPEHKYLDDSWIEGLSPHDKLAFDCMLGARNARFGYERDRFSPVECDAFWHDRDSRLAQAAATEQAIGKPASSPTAPAWKNRLLKRFWFMRLKS
jgi:hypothetical protein